MKKYIKRVLSLLGIRNKKYIQCCFDYDANSYMTYSGLQGETLPIIAAKIRIICHTIEKALSLSDCRADFGREKIIELIRLYNIYKSSTYAERNALEIVESTILTYSEHRQAHGLDVSFIPTYLQKMSSSDIKCGAHEFLYSKADYITFPSIAESRHSVRNYSDQSVAKDDIIRAVQIAQTAPSACNRQASRIYAITNPAKISVLKQRHGGIRSFGQPGVIFAIAQDINQYINEYERNTWLVDGGIFCMNLLYALNSVGIVSCPVIWGGMEDEDRFITELTGMPKNERVVVLVVGGYPPNEVLKTPYSPKRPVLDIIKLID